MRSFNSQFHDEYEDYYYVPVGGDPYSQFVNFRLEKPKNYNPGRTEPYPMIIMLHGAGEIGRVWSGSVNYTPSDEEYDNNGRSLIHGGWQQWYAVSQGHHPVPAYQNAPWATEWSWDGFVLYPQSSYNAAWNGGLNAEVCQIIESLFGAFNIDPDRVYVHGLSNGAEGVWDIIQQRPDLFAAASPMSGAGPDICAPKCRPNTDHDGKWWAGYQPESAICDPDDPDDGKPMEPIFWNTPQIQVT